MAPGKALLAVLPQSELRRVLASLQFKKLAENPIVSARKLEKHLRIVHRLGYGWEEDEGEVGVGCVAAPIFGPSHEVWAAVSLAGTTQHISKARIPSIAPSRSRHMPG